MAEQYVCAISSKAGRNCGSGIVFQFEEEFWCKLLQEPSCLLKKYGRGAFESAAAECCYVLLTAHSNIYNREKEKEMPVKKYIDDGDFSLAFGRLGAKLRLRDCVAIAGDGRCIAVTCCGADSILVLCRYEDLRLSFTLKSHNTPENCSINSNFLLLFLRAEVVKEHLSDCNPPALGLGGPFAAGTSAEVLWRNESSVVQKKSLVLSPTHSRDLESMSLQKKVKQLCQLQTVGTATETENAPCYVGAPVLQCVPDGGSTRIIGFYSGEKKITTAYGMFSLLKGGVEHFLAAMNAKETTTTSTLMPSRWEYHITAFLEGISTPDSILDLLHILLYQNKVKMVPLLKCNLEGGPTRPELIAVLNILTAIFRRYKELERDVACPPQLPCNDECGCLGKIEIILEQLSHYFAYSDDQSSDIAEALFECVHQMQYFNYRDIAQTTLEKIRTHLDQIGKRKDSSNAANRSFKWIDILARERAHNKPSQQATNGRP